MKMEKGFKKPLARQIREGVEIEMSNETLMNSKSEWNSARIPRIVIEEGERQTEDIESALGKKGEQEKSERRKECLVECLSLYIWNNTNYYMDGNNIK